MQFPVSTSVPNIRVLEHLNTIASIFVERQLKPTIGIHASQHLCKFWVNSSTHLQAEKLLRQCRRPCSSVLVLRMCELVHIPQRACNILAQVEGTALLQHVGVQSRKCLGDQSRKVRLHYCANLLSRVGIRSLSSVISSHRCFFTLSTSAIKS